jgi:DNA-binding beta-propeller fold protein YncE
MRMAAAAGLAACVGALAGCGNTYRPVVATVGVIGPAAQPAKYAIAVSTPTETPVGAEIANTGAWSAATTYSINQGVSYQGSLYVSLKNGNVGQNPATATAFWSLLTNGLMTMVDFSGDTVMVTATLGVNPYYLTLNSGGNNGYTLNSDGTMTSFGVSTTLISSQVLESTLLPASNPVSLFASVQSVYISDAGVNAIDQMVGSPPALKQELPVAPGYSPLYVVGQAGAARIYEITPSTSGGLGQVSAIENASSLTSSPTVSTTLPVGRGPVYGVMTLDDRRAFILNQTDGTVTVINAVNNALDTPVNTIPVGTRPVWADLASGLDELVVANEGNGTTTPGSVSIINIPLCSSSALPTNPNCDPTNPIDATTFGQVVATVPVGINPIMVSVLSDYTRAYVANAGNPALPCAANGVAVAGVSTTCTVSVVNLTSNTVTATIPISGHPVYIAATAGTPTGKVYVVCKDSQVMTVIETDTDSVDTTIPLQGYGVSVRVTQP